MMILMSVPQTIRSNERKAKSPARHHEAYRSRLVRLGCELLEDRVMLSAALPDYTFAAPTLITGTTQHVATSSPGAFAETPGGTTNRSVSYGSINAALPAAPPFTVTVLSSSQINVAWTGVAGATGYVVESGISGVYWKQNHIAGSGSGSCAVTGLSASTTYLFDVGASNTVGTTWSNVASAKTLAPTPTPPAAPWLTATAVSTSQINLSWNSAAGATSYLVDELINSSWTQIGSQGSGSTSYAVNYLSAGTTYSFKVGASNTVGTTWSNVASAKTLFPTPVVVDHPAADTAYSPVSGSLFGATGPSYLDVHQGAVGDCWLMTSLAEVATRNPSDIQNMFTDLGSTTENGSVVELYKVRFFDSAGTPEYITADTELPSGGGYYDRVTNSVLWVALAEKAYAEANGAGVVTTQHVGSDSYAALNGGDPSWALQAITGKPASMFPINPANIAAAAWNAGQLNVLCSSPNAGDNLIVGDSNGTHAYAVISYNASSSTPFELYNPWGLSSVVGHTSSFNGHQVYDGPFWFGSSLISQDFASQTIGTGTAAGLDVHGNSSQEVAGSANTGSPNSTSTRSSAKVVGNPLRITDGSVAAVGSSRHAFHWCHGGHGIPNHWEVPESKLVCTGVLQTAPRLRKMRGAVDQN